MLLLGGYDKEEKAARAYDLAALKYWGPTTHINFPVCFLRHFTVPFIEMSCLCSISCYDFNYFVVPLRLYPTLHLFISCFFNSHQLSTYEKELEEMKHMTRQEFVANLRRYIPTKIFPINTVFRCLLLGFLIKNIDQVYSFSQIDCGLSFFRCVGCRKSSGFSRGASVYRGVTRYGQKFWTFNTFIIKNIDKASPLFTAIPAFQLTRCYYYYKRWSASFVMISDTINMEGGKLGLVELQETKTCILVHLVSLSIPPFLDLFYFFWTTYRHKSSKIIHVSYYSLFQNSFLFTLSGFYSFICNQSFESAGLTEPVHSPVKTGHWMNHSKLSQRLDLMG